MITKWIKWCSSSETNTFHHISSASNKTHLTHSPVKCLHHDSEISLSWLIQNTDIPLLLLLTHPPCTILPHSLHIFFLHTGPTSSYTAAYNEMFTIVMVQCHCHVVVSRYSSSIHGEICRNEDLTQCCYCETIKRRCAPCACAHVCVCVRAFKIMTFTILFPRTFHWYTFRASVRASVI